VRTLPMCSSPVGLGAKRTRTFDVMLSHSSRIYRVKKMALPA
jgi:hypothetical protein